MIEIDKAPLPQLFLQEQFYTIIDGCLEFPRHTQLLERISEAIMIRLGRSE